jgi:hypothetical protein
MMAGGWSTGLNPDDGRRMVYRADLDDGRRLVY